MPWPWLLALLVALVVGFWLGAKAAGAGFQDTAQRLLRTHAIDRNNYLRVLRREIANHLMQRDPTKFERLYESVADEVWKYETFSKIGLAAEHRAICERYPQYSDFDFIGTREHVLYPDAFSWNDDESVSEHFRYIVKFQALNALLDRDWKHFRATSEDDLEHLREYTRRVLDTRLRKKMVRAMSLYYQARGESLDFEADEFSVVHVSHVAELRRGIHFKKTGEYGLHTLFDDHVGHYRSDATFDEQSWLDTIRDSYEETA